MSETPDRVRSAWAGGASGAHYESSRWRRRGHAERDPKRIAALLERFPAREQHGLVLDAPCGTGRLRSSLLDQGRYIGLDLSSTMLGAGSGARLRAELEHLPFRDRAFGLVVCCRLLHHLREQAALAAVVQELVRVSADRLVLTYWDSRSLPALRRRLRGRSGKDRRCARARSELVALLRAAGAEVLGGAFSLRFLSQQSYLIARRVR